MYRFSGWKQINKKRACAMWAKCMNISECFPFWKNGRNQFDNTNERIVVRCKVKICNKFIL